MFITHSSGTFRCRLSKIINFVIYQINSLNK
jgi:hypothetical protein